MKYVRTKYELYEATGEEDENWLVVKDEFCGTIAIKKMFVTKQADTIEELCDEFVDIDNHDFYKIHRDGGKTFVVSKTRRFLGNYDIRLPEIGRIMGAIWTTGSYGEPILKTVTKPLNEKGEWELL